MEKRKKHLFRFFFLLLFSMTLSCGGGGGGSGGGGSEANGDGSASRPLTITDVRVFRPSAPDNPIEPTNVRQMSIYLKTSFSKYIIQTQLQMLIGFI